MCATVNVTMAGTDLGVSYSPYINLKDFAVEVPMRLDLGRLTLTAGNLFAPPQEHGWNYQIRYNQPLGVFFSYLTVGARMNSSSGWSGEMIGLGTRMRIGNFVLRLQPQLILTSVVPRQIEDINIGFEVSTQIDLEEALKTLDAFLQSV